MKKLRGERLISKLEGISICLMDEIEYIDNRGCTSGVYTKDDLEHIIIWTNLLTKYSNNIDNRLTTTHMYHVCRLVIQMCKHIMYFIDKEEI